MRLFETAVLISVENWFGLTIVRLAGNCMSKYCTLWQPYKPHSRPNIYRYKIVTKPRVKYKFKKCYTMEKNKYGTIVSKGRCQKYPEGVEFAVSRIIWLQEADHPDHLLRKADNPDHLLRDVGSSAFKKWIVQITRFTNRMNCLTNPDEQPLKARSSIFVKPVHPSLLSQFIHLC